MIVPIQLVFLSLASAVLRKKFQVSTICQRLGIILRLQSYDFGDTPPLFVEQFNKRLNSWRSSATYRQISSDVEPGYRRIEYSKDWSINEPTIYPGFLGDRGLILDSPEQYYAISTPLTTPLNFGNTTFVLQYEVKLQNGLDCGGAYIKLFCLATEKDHLFRPEEVNEHSPFALMFGPDRCGSKDVVHFRLGYKNKKTGEIQEKHIRNPLMIRSTKLSTLYTLIMRSNGSFEILINREIVQSGDILTDFEPPLIPPKYIDDPFDVKPVDWDDREKIPDPTAVKPPNWDNDCSLYTADEAAVMPEGWMVEEPEMIPDPLATRPPYWQNDEDGTWEAPMIVNPRCIIGCGPWNPPLKKHPNCAGPWTPPLIDNPAYRGSWKPKRIPNPEHYDDPSPMASLFPVNGVGFELFTMQGGILFDNIIITGDEMQARAFAEATWMPKYDIERIALQQDLYSQGLSDENPADDIEEDKSTWSASFGTRYQMAFLKIIDDLCKFKTMAHTEPISAISEYPLIAAFILISSFLVAYLISSVIFWTGMRQARPDKIQDKSKLNSSDTIQIVSKTEKVLNSEDLTVQQESTQAVKHSTSQLPIPVSPARPLKL